jgi:hypothetical protein
MDSLRSRGSLDCGTMANHGHPLCTGPALAKATKSGQVRCVAKENRTVETGDHPKARSRAFALDLLPTDEGVRILAEDAPPLQRKVDQIAM